MISEREKQDRDELFRLMKENPDLPVVPMVDGEILGVNFEKLAMGLWDAGYRKEET